MLINESWFKSGMIDNSCMPQYFENNDYSLQMLCNVWIDITMVGHIQAISYNLHNVENLTFCTVEVTGSRGYKHIQEQWTVAIIW